MAQSPLTGQSYEIEIGASARPKVITVKTDDEVKWVNVTSSALELSVTKPMSASYSCRRGFADEKVGDFAGGLNPYIVLVAKLTSKDIASLCFSSSGIYEYSVRTIVDPGKEETKYSGTVMVK